ncbi:MAG: hypothetical protein A2513_06870 [Sulfurimonas sp. RIFOXYD12_FULL_33_39]|uniref:methyltransferase domain-containing protein n=1 Tax=unclassified Sulfurimonas TaxID=2623549 RepID=UPI0008B7960A|nr:MULTISPECIES: methyltransferase domain-containing protein [unclassified Sulfurimonas]OHE10575.1 MAG: hypothetical protein A2513_06870 [Sulfurimonas sp. RIFOXYD12_FULL_33_39]OHE15034.1 MAG: hypothetical protein A2530_01060 [Sulfurimonas sp. RIFOXYD2_FULL_34_21]
MIKTNIPNLTDIEIMQKIKQESQRKKCIIVKAEKPFVKLVAESDLKVNNIYIFAVKVGRLLKTIGLDKFVKQVQKILRLYPQNSIYVMDTFTEYYDEDFIHNAYNLILRREPDENKKNYYLSLLRSGKLSKTEIITSLYFSKEGMKQNVIILGIKKRYILSLIYKIPFLGYIAKIIFTLLTIPRFLERINSYENLFYSKLKIQENIQNNLLLQLETKSSNETVANLEKYFKLQLETKSSNERVSDIQSELEMQREEITNKLKTKAVIKDFESYLQAVNYAKDYMKITEQNMQNLIDEAKKRLPDEIFKQNELLRITGEEKYQFDTFYVEFEDRFRGDRKEIKDKVKPYLSYMQNLPFKKEDIKVLDVGCGRGEWLELLKENDYINLKGVDLNRIMIENSKKLGLDVLESDAIDYLSNQEDDSLSVITGFHIIEHLSFEVLMKLFQESYRVLQKGGMVIFETPNPENIAVGAFSFYTDPTHKNPLVPDTAKFLLEYNYFKDVEIKRLNGTFDIDLQNDFLNHQFRSQFDYSVIGYKL